LAIKKINLKEERFILVHSFRGPLARCARESIMVSAHLMAYGKQGERGREQDPIMSFKGIPTMT
jgi:hypothetical protein